MNSLTVTSWDCVNNNSAISNICLPFDTRAQTFLSCCIYNITYIPLVCMTSSHIGTRQATGRRRFLCISHIWHHHDVSGPDWGWYLQQWAELRTNKLESLCWSCDSHFISRVTWNSSLSCRRTYWECFYGLKLMRNILQCILMRVSNSFADWELQIAHSF